MGNNYKIVPYKYDDPFFDPHNMRGKRWDIINTLIKSRKYSSYLEIGVRDCVDTQSSFSKIQCEEKYGVDPKFRNKEEGEGINLFEMTSDEFFEQNDKTFDIIFIDGLHLEEQSTKDIDNSLKILNNGGCIIMHDCSPPFKEFQREEYKSMVVKGCENLPGDKKFQRWNGTVWKSFVKKRRDPNLRMFVIDVDYGVGYIARGSQISELNISDEDITFENLDKNRKEWLELYSSTSFYKWVQRTSGS